MLNMVVGVSGSGKSTVTALLVRALNAQFLPSYTTRPRRDSDNLENHSHIFVKDMPPFCVSASYGKIDYGFDTRQLNSDKLQVASSRIPLLIKRVQEISPTRIYLLDTPLQLVYERLHYRKTPVKLSALYLQRTELLRLRPNVIIQEEFSSDALGRLLEYISKDNF